jgi:hypothetical protein
MQTVRQKGVDICIGVDVASLSFKKQVDKIVLFAGDADFVPAAKLGHFFGHSGTPPGIRFATCGGG